MRKSKRLEDGDFDREIARMSGLANFPALIATKGELRRALRRISETDKDFIHRLISEVVDTNEKCPTPAELIRRAGEMRAHAGARSLGNPDCEQCHGSGWVSCTKRVELKGLQPYDAEVAKRCTCHGSQN